MTPPNLYRSKAPIQIVHRGLPLWAFRFLAARQGSRLSVREPTRLGRDEAWACLPLAKAARGCDVMAIGGTGWKAACGLGARLSLLWIRRPLEWNFAHCDERPKALPLEKSSLRLDFQESQGDSCQTNAVGLHHPLKRRGQGQLRWPGNFISPTALITR